MQLATTGESQKLRFYHARHWLGMPLGVWFPLWARNGFTASRYGQVFRMLVFAPGNSVLHGLDRLIYSRRVDRAPPPKPPLFVVGHWRTGTTMLHELLIQDSQFGFPTTYQVMTPHHFLLTERLMPVLFNHTMPKHRPMDNMLIGFDKPQEDEFALCNLGVPSPYFKWIFPRHYPEPGLHLDVQAFAERDRRRWEEGLRRFVRRLSYRDPRRMVLKSPTHTARLDVLARLFPGAQFLHIVRDPYQVFASTVHTWKRLWDSMGVHAPRFDGIEEYVLATFERMYECFERDRASLADGRLHELRYEDLLQNPLREMQEAYEQLGLPDFDEARPRLEAYFADHQDYRTNRHELSDDLRGQIASRWRGYIERYGYE